ncbi:translocation/assembly module TamB [Desulfovibrio sp. OttesenSCG-928-O18]|nr:translocation/assembly module TamB [Desulfovibrio sp. OttesenSCG-928-O18]
MNHLEPLHRDDLFLRLSGRIDVDGPLDTMNVAVGLEVERGELSLLTTLGGGVRTLEITDPSATPVSASAGPSCDIKVAIPGRFFIRGRGLDSEWEGNLAVKGPLSGPALTGSLKPVRGTFDLLSRPFAFDKGDISFFGGDRINPALNLALTYTGPNITAVVHAGGTAKKPELVMESRPPLPQDQIMAEVLFGKDFSQLSRFEALQVANSVRQLANIGDGGLDPLATMRTSLGLDMLRVGSSGPEASDNRSVSGAPGASAMGGGQSSQANGESSATPTVEAGKYINDAIYVGVEQGATAESTGVRVEVELRPNLTLQGKSTARSSEVGLGWKRDY